jgi:transcriptional regulator GlxA family with amidase domain
VLLFTWRRRLWQRTWPAAWQTERLYTGALDTIDAIGRRIAPAAGPSPPIARAMALARVRFAGRLTVGALARAAAMGPSRFHERFRQEIGVTPAQYIADLRLDHAAALLRSGRMPIAEIALAAGFSDQSAMTRCLRRRRGVTPAALRRQA